MDTLLYGHDRERATKLLRACKLEGVSQIRILLLPAGEPLPNAYGEYALGYGGQGHRDLSLPNPAFFQHLDWLAKQVRRMGMTLAIQPASAQAALLKEDSPELQHEFGRYLGKRYRSQRGVRWLRSHDEEGKWISKGIELFAVMDRDE